jgi:hypothetical protein
MSIFKKDRDERYKDYCEDTNMFARKDFEEWSRIETRAEEIASGLVMGTFDRDEAVWKRVKEIEDGK